MIIPLDKLLYYNENKYVFTKAAMRTVDKVANIRNYAEKDTNWKVVPNVLKHLLNNDIKFSLIKESEE